MSADDSTVPHSPQGMQCGCTADCQHNDMDWSLSCHCLQIADRYDRTAQTLRSTRQPFPHLTSYDASAMMTRWFHGRLEPSSRQQPSWKLQTMGLRCMLKFHRWVDFVTMSEATRYMVSSWWKHCHLVSAMQAMNGWEALTYNQRFFCEWCTVLMQPVLCPRPRSCSCHSYYHFRQSHRRHCEYLRCPMCPRQNRPNVAHCRVSSYKVKWLVTKSSCTHLNGEPQHGIPATKYKNNTNLHKRIHK